MAWGLTVRLTTGIDSFTGGAGNDTINAPRVDNADTFSSLDAINGGAGTDTANIVFGGDLTTAAGSTVANIETVNLTAAAAITAADVRGWTGLQTLNVASSSTIAGVHAAATTDINVANALQSVAVTGGNNVTINATGVNDTADTISTIGATGIVTVTSAGANLVDVGGLKAQTQGQITVTGGTSINVTTTGTVSGGSDDAGDALTLSRVEVNGNASTTTVAVTQTAAQARVADSVGVTGKAAIVNGEVDILDANHASATAAGTITTVTLNSFGTGSTINSGALTTVNLSGTGADLAVTNGALTTPTVTTQALNVNGLTTTGAITLDTDITTLNIKSSTAASTINSLAAAGATTVNVAGDAALTLTAQTLTAATAINVTNTAGASFGTALGANVTFTGGAGDDGVELGTAFNKAITMGAGNDTINAGTLVIAHATDGGAGTDTLVLGDAGQLTAATAAKISNFEVLRIQSASGGDTFNAALLTGLTGVVLGSNTGAVTVDNMSAAMAGNVTIAGNQTAAATTLNVTGAKTVNQLDTLTLNINDGAAATSTVTVADVIAVGVETVRIVATDNLTLNTAAGLTALTRMEVSGAGAVTVNAVAAGPLNVNTVVDASASTGLFVFNASQAAAVNGIAITGSATKASTITGSAGEDVITGGAAADSLLGGAGNDNINGGAGADTINGEVGNDTITAGEGADVVTIGAGQDTVILTETTAAADTLVWGTAFAAGSANAATVSGFAFGAGADLIDITTFNLLNGTTAATNTLAALAPVAVASNGTATANDVIFTFNGAGDLLAAGTTVANAVANAVLALTSGTDFSSANIASGDSLILQMNDGTNTFVFHYLADAVPATTAAADLALIGVFTGTTVQALVGDFI